MSSNLGAYVLNVGARLKSTPLAIHDQIHGYQHGALQYIIHTVYERVQYCTQRTVYMYSTGYNAYEHMNKERQKRQDPFERGRQKAFHGRQESKLGV